MKKLLFSVSCIAVSALAIGSMTLAGVATKDTKSIDVPVAKVEEIEVPEVANVSAPSITVTELEIEEAKEQIMYPLFAYDKEWSSEEKYLLAKIATAEAEGSTTQCKTLVIMAALNRVQSDEFPDTIRKVIFQCSNGVYQFSCVGNGRWDRVEPDQDSYEAVEVVRNSEYDYSGGCLYFESCEEEDNWHSRNLDFLYQCDALRFYK